MGKSRLGKPNICCMMKMLKYMILNFVKLSLTTEYSSSINKLCIEEFLPFVVPKG
jgi:hypothetical protein